MIQRACYVSCDNCGDPAEVTTDNDAKTARAIARRQKYTRERMDGAFVDLCPACAGTPTLTGERVRQWNYHMGLDPSTL